MKVGGLIEAGRMYAMQVAATATVSADESRRPH